MRGMKKTRIHSKMPKKKPMPHIGGAMGKPNNATVRDTPHTYTSTRRKK